MPRAAGFRLPIGASFLAPVRRTRQGLTLRCPSCARSIGILFTAISGVSATGKDRVGRFELADGGTLFLDEVSNIDLGIQSKLLRVLQTRTFERVGGQKPISLDGAKTEHRFLAEPMDEVASAEKLFERRWAMALLEQILAKLESEFCVSSNAGLFAQLKPLLSGEQTELSYAELGQRFGISEANVKVTVHRLRRRYRELLREEVANTVESPDQIDDEIRHLFAAFS